MKKSHQKYVDDELNKNTIPRFYQTLQNYLNVSVANNVYNLTKYNRKQMIDTTNIRTRNSGGYLLPLWKIECKDEINAGEKIRATKAKSPAPNSGSRRLPPIGDSFMYME